MVRPLLLAEPGPGDASCTTWTLSVYVHPLHFQAGRPSSKSAFDRRRSCDLCRALPIRRPSSSVSSLATFLVSFKSVDLLRPFPAFRPSPSASSLTAFSVRFQPYGLLRSSCDTSLAVGGFLCNGESKLLLEGVIVKALTGEFRILFSTSA